MYLILGGYNQLNLKGLNIGDNIIAIWQLVNECDVNDKLYSMAL